MQTVPGAGNGNGTSWSSRDDTDQLRATLPDLDDDKLMEIVRDIEDPTPNDYRRALLGLLEATGSDVVLIGIDDHLCAFVMANPREVPEAQAATYCDHLVEAAKLFVEAAESARGTLSKLTTASVGET